MGADAAKLVVLADDFVRTTCVPLYRAGAEPGRGYQEALYSTPDMLQAEVHLLEAASGADPSGRLRADREAVA